MSTLGVDTHLKEGLGWEPVDPEYFMFNVNPVAIPASTKKFTTHKKEPNRFYYRMDLVEVNNLNRQHKPCKDNPDYSFLACLRKSIALKVIFIKPAR